VLLGERPLPLAWLAAPQHQGSLTVSCLRSLRRAVLEFDTVSSCRQVSACPRSIVREWLMARVLPARRRESNTLSASVGTASEERSGAPHRQLIRPDHALKVKPSVFKHRQVASLASAHRGPLTAVRSKARPAWPRPLHSALPLPLPPASPLPSTTPSPLGSPRSAAPSRPALPPTPSLRS
jgi:hypothetical protein